MNGVLDVLKVFIHKIGDYQKTFVLSSRSRFMKHLEEGHGAVPGPLTARIRGQPVMKPVVGALEP